MFVTTNVYKGNTTRKNTRMPEPENVEIRPVAVPMGQQQSMDSTAINLMLDTKKIVKGLAKLFGATFYDPEKGQLKEKKGRRILPNWTIDRFVLLLENYNNINFILSDLNERDICSQVLASFEDTYFFFLQAIYSGKNETGFYSQFELMWFLSRIIDQIKGILNRAKNGGTTKSFHTTFSIGEMRTSSQLQSGNQSPPKLWDSVRPRQ